MILPLLLALGGAVPDSSGVVYDGRSGGLSVRPPRQEAEITVDGVLDEPVWSQAAVLRGFSQFSPNDGVPAQDSTEVLIWYSPSAIYFGIRAYEAHGEVHATLANRDKIFADDNVQILLGTFNDGRQATFFAVNPLGVQADGALVESGSQQTGFTGGVAARESPDLSPDYVFQSRGRVTPYGYEVEVRIPFKSLHYKRGREHTWSLNLVRQVKHSGFEDTWAPAKRASASFLGQSGALTGLEDLRRGLVVDLNPEFTSKVNGGPDSTGNWNYDFARPGIGGNARWGVSDNLTLNASVNPDFSQVESDVGQIAFDPRQALFFSEKRPFFLDGIENFTTPNQLIYTRRIVQPLAAVKLTGKSFGTNLAFLSAVDGHAGSSSGVDHPVTNVLRAQRDIGKQSRIGFAYTDRIDGRDYNRVADLDGRILFGGVYSAEYQLAGSVTRQNGVTTTAPLWQARFDRNGHAFGFRNSLNAIADDFRAGSGFIGRTGVVQALVNPSYTIYGKPGGWLQRFTGDIALYGTWQYQNFIHGRNIQDQKIHFNANATVRGGWALSGGLFIESFGYDSGLFANYAIEVPKTGGGLDTLPFTGVPTIPNFEGFLQVVTPQFKKLDGFAFALYGHDENFFEWSSSWLLFAQGGLNLRPTNKLRMEFSYFWQKVWRRSDGSLVNEGRIPRLKIEYQLARSVFIRLVGQYEAQHTDSLRDDSRTHGPILFRTGQGYLRSAVDNRNVFRGDVLFSYQPTPGTVLFAGYGSTLDEPRAFKFQNLTRATDGFFLKLSYLYRL